MAAGPIIKTLKGAVAARRLVTGVTSLDDLDAALEGADSTANLFGRIADRAAPGPEARLAAELETAVAAGGDTGDRLVLLQQMVDLSLPAPRRLADLGLDAPAIAADMCDRLRQPEGARAEDYAFLHARFARLVTPPLQALLDDPGFVDGIEPRLWQALFRQLARLDRIEADIDDLPNRMLAVLEASGVLQAARHKGVTRQLVIAIARKYSSDVDDFDSAVRALERAVEVAIRVQQEGAAGSNIDDFVDEVLRRVAALNREGRLDEAGAEVTRALAEAEQEAERAQARTLRLLHAAEEQAILSRDAPAAARHILRRLELDHPDPATRFPALGAVWEEWYVRGRDGGLNLDLRVSVALAKASRALARDADQRGKALNALGISLATVGEREGDAEALRAAVDAYRAALQELTRDRVPLDWAMTQNNLGNALKTLGEREGDAGALRAAVDAFRAALQEYTPDKVPLHWAATQNNLGNALQTLGEREGDAEALRAAVDAYRAALQERTRDRVPLDWATTQNNLGTALQTLGTREGDTEALRAAVDAYRAALQEFTRDREPLDWATTQNNLGNALAILGAREGDAKALRAAVAACRAALEERTRDRVPVDWGATQHNMAGALLMLFWLSGEAAAWAAAREHAQAAVAVWREFGAAGYLPGAEARLARIEAARPE